jgi:Mrp family chromosome partitioning ATPase/uncharacterized protein involved in exopolysaccharide biosynthesis
VATTADRSFDEPTVLTAVWRYRWLVLFLAIAFAGLGWLYASQTAKWTAEATLAVQDPRTSNLFDQGVREEPERYVEGQIAILKSRAVARRAVDIASEQTPPIELTVTGIVNGLAVNSTGNSDIVILGYTADTQRVAIGAVNSVAAAYQDIGRITADTAFAETVEELDVSIAALEVTLLELDTDVELKRTQALVAIDGDPVRIVKITLLGDLTTQLNELVVPPTTASDGLVNQFNQGLSLLTFRITSLTNDLERERTALLALDRDDPERIALIGRQGEAQRRLTDLQSRRDQLAVDADLTSSGVVFYSPAETAQPSGGALFIILGFMLGAVLAAALAVVLASRKRRFESRNEPEQILGVRLLADVPNFKEEKVGSVLPVVDAPSSASAEAFRFVSASISLQQMWPVNEDGVRNFSSVVTTSAGLSEGKTVVTANTAFAAAREGHNVLVLDADFGNQQLTALLLGDVPPQFGMTDVVAREKTLAKAVIDIPHEGSGSIHLLSRGTTSVRATDFFSTPTTAKLFDVITAKYDLVLIDAPPILRVAYATTLARLADRAMLVIAHGEDVRAAEELRDKMDLVGIPALGYVYNLAPLRAEMTLSAGSMADTLGEHPSSVVEIDLK